MDSYIEKTKFIEEYSKLLSVATLHGMAETIANKASGEEWERHYLRRYTGQIKGQNVEVFIGNPTGSNDNERLSILGSEVIVSGKINVPSSNTGETKSLLLGCDNRWYRQNSTNNQISPADSPLAMFQ